MNLEQKITEIEKKLDTVLHILGHGRTKSHAEIVREVEADVERIRARSEKRNRRPA